MKKNNTPTREEKQLATEMQAPVKPTAITKPGMFTALLNQPMADAKQILGGGEIKWINAMDDINPLFPTGGKFSRPFVVIRAWQFTSATATQKDRCGLRLVMPDQKVYGISLSYPFKMDDDTGELRAVYPDRQLMVDHFAASSTPIGLMQFEKVDRGQSNPYWRLIHADEHSLELAGEKMPTPESDAQAIADGTPF